MVLVLIYLLMLVGLILIFLEFIILPGLITGIIGGFMIIGSLVMTFILKGAFWGIFNLLISLIFLILIFILIRKFKLRDRLVLKVKHTNSSNGLLKDEAYDKLLNLTGITLTELKPSGYILVEEKKFEAISERAFIPRNQKVKVVSIESSQLKVINIEEQP